MSNVHLPALVDPSDTSGRDNMSFRKMPAFNPGLYAALEGHEGYTASKSDITKLDKYQVRLESEKQKVVNSKKLERVYSNAVPVQINHKQKN